MRNFRLRLPFRCTFGPRIGMAVPFRTIFARWMMRHFGALFLVAAEDHLSGGRLQHAGDGRLAGLADHLARVVYNHHRAIVQLSDALTQILPLFQDEYLPRLARPVNGVHRVPNLVDVQYSNTPALRT